MTVDFAELKKYGFLQQRDEQKFIIRLRSIGGDLKAEELKNLAQLAEKYGEGYVHFTIRQGIEIPGVSIGQWEKVREDITAMGLYPGASGPKIRTVVACPGNEVCRLGLVNTKNLAARIDKQFFAREFRKTKIAVSGCPNSCAKPQENDIGLHGAVEIKIDSSRCSGCGVCTKICPSGALELQNERICYDAEKCLNCGKCFNCCPNDGFVKLREGFHVYAGGKVGRYPQLGVRIAEFIPEEQILEMIEAILEVFQKNGPVKGERIANIVNKVGKESFQNQVRSNFTARIQRQS